jgi:hypothetical protein
MDHQKFLHHRPYRPRQIDAGGRFIQLCVSDREMEEKCSTRWIWSASGITIKAQTAALRYGERQDLT